MDEYEEPLDHTFAALAHPARRRMIQLLSKEPARVTDLASHFDCSLNVVSKHIQSLERAGLVMRNKKGRVHELTFDAAPLADASSFIARYQVRWEKQFDRLSSYLDGVAKARKKDKK